MQTGDRITWLSAANFKSIGRKEQGIAIRPLTILAGANSSGKSTLMQPLLLVKQTLEQRGEPEGPLNFEGPNVQYSKVEQFLSRVTGAKPDSCSFGFGFGAGDLQTTFRVEFVYSEQTRLQVKSNSVETPGAPPSALPKDPSTPAIRRLFFLYSSSPGDQILDWFGNEKIEVLARLCEQVVHVPGIRDTQGRHFPVRAAGPLYRGTFPQYTASVIHSWQQNGGRERLDTLSRWLRAMELTGDVEARRRDDVSIEIQVGRLLGASPQTTGDFVSIADVGFGVSQVLPALVALLAAEDTGLVYIEQPELHLHPNAQVRLGAILAETALRGPSVVVETHGSLLIQEIQTLIATGQLPPESVALHWFRRDPKSGATTVETATIDENGAYGDWPIDFDSVELSTQRRYLDAVSLRRNG